MEKMAKQGMKRPETDNGKNHESIYRVPEIQGKAKCGKVKANPIIEPIEEPALKVFHQTPHSGRGSDAPIDSAYGIIDSDLARDNIENDIPEADKKNM